MSVDNKERGNDILHSSTSKHIVILGGGFAGIGVLKKGCKDKFEKIIP